LFIIYSQTLSFPQFAENKTEVIEENDSSEEEFSLDDLDEEESFMTKMEKAKERMKLSILTDLTLEIREKNSSSSWQTRYTIWETAIS
jgi:hypothetical protein